MKNSVFKYEYNCYGDYKPCSVNIGDYIQSIAARLFYNRCDILIDRDSLVQVSDDIKLIGNGWYCLDSSRHFIGDSIKFLPISIHVNNRSNDALETVKSFVKSGCKIGCRDYGTLEYLQNNGIDAYFSSCLTTTITADKLGLKNAIRSGIIYSDFDMSILSPPPP